MSAPPYYFHLSIELSFGPVRIWQGLFLSPILSHFIFTLMRAPLVLPPLPFDAGTIIFSPGIRVGLVSFTALRPYLDHMIECHLATDFGIVTRAMRFDNVLAALTETGHLTSRYFLHASISPPHTGVIITTHLDDHTTTIRFASEQE